MVLCNEGVDLFDAGDIAETKVASPPASLNQGYGLGTSDFVDI